jgi:hypothetical protein
MTTTGTPTRLQANDFSWYAPDRMFTAEASGLGLRAGQVLITLVSRYEGVGDIVFKLAHTETREGDVMWWDYAAEGDDPGFTIRIWND